LEKKFGNYQPIYTKAEGKYKKLLFACLSGR